MSVVAERPLPLDAAPVTGDRALLRVGLVPYLNAWPVAWGLDGLRDWQTTAMVPSALARALGEGDIDLSLGSSIDAVRIDPQPLVIPVAPIASNGPTRTVQLVSSVPPAEITHLHCDTDSHTSVALARILLRDVWGVDPELVPWDARAGLESWGADDTPRSVLMIGDKVMTDIVDPAVHAHTIDLGEAWCSATGLPFVFAVWMLRAECADRARGVAAVLDRQRRANLMRFEAMVAAGARQHGWPLRVAEGYLADTLCYEFGAAQRQGYEAFVQRCVEHDLLPGGTTIRWADVH